MLKCRTLVVLGTIVLVLSAALAYRYVQRHGFGANVAPGRVETFLARKARSLATTGEVRRRVNPLQPDELAIAEGRDHFADHCAVCHGNDGSGRTQFGSRMYPPAPDMRAPETQGLTDGELFSIVRNGIRFTGMPAFGGEDEENWKLVLFIRRLPQISARELELMRDINSLQPESDSARPPQK
jgi:mono/diheme cytochrome c family protein